jgi:hypothetical protein
MFGFLNPIKHSPNFRRVYRRCCHFQHANYSIRSLPFLSFESVFLYHCALDGEGRKPDHLPVGDCCLLRRSSRLKKAPDWQLGLFCSSLSMLLAEIKLKDDIADERSIAARLWLWSLKHQIKSAHRFFIEMDEKFEEKVSQYLNRHTELEKTNETLDLAEYMKPTAEAFGYVFGLLAR